MPARFPLIGGSTSNKPSAGSKLCSMTTENRGKNQRNHTNVISLI